MLFITSNEDHTHKKKERKSSEQMKIPSNIIQCRVNELLSCENKLIKS